MITTVIFLLRKPAFQAFLCGGASFSLALHLQALSGEVLHGFLYRSPRHGTGAASSTASDRTPDICRGGSGSLFLSPWRDACEMCAVKWLVSVGLFLLFFILFYFIYLFIGISVFWFNPFGFQFQLLNLSICQWCDKFSLVIREQLPIARARMAFGLFPAVWELAVSKNALCTQWKKAPLLPSLPFFPSSVAASFPSMLSRHIWTIVQHNRVPSPKDWN